MFVLHFLGCPPLPNAVDAEMVNVIAQMVDKDTKKKQAKQLAHQKKQVVTIGVDSPASTAMATPPPPQAEFLDDFDDYYRERKNSFDFSG